MMDDDHRPAGVSQRSEHVENRFFGRGIDTRERLVHEVELRVLDQGPRQKHPLLLTAREAADLPLREVRHPDPVQGLHRGVR